MFGPDSPVRFLARGSALLIVMLALWSVALRTPMLFLLRVSESSAFRALTHADSVDPIVVDDAGDWNFRVAIGDQAGAVIGRSGPAKFRAIEFTIPGSDVALFTFSVPVFWAVLLATPQRSSCIRALLWGTALVSLMEVLSLLANAEMLAYGAAAQLHLVDAGVGAWSRELGTRLVVGVIPFTGPVVVGVALNANLRSQIFVVGDRSAQKRVERWIS